MVTSKANFILITGLAKDDSTLRDLKVTKAAKLMVVGSTMNDVLQVTNTPTQKELQEEEKAATSKEPLSQQKVISFVLCILDQKYFINQKYRLMFLQTFV